MAAIKRPPPLRVWGGVEEAATAVDRLAAPHRHRSLVPVRPTSLQRPLRWAPTDGPCFSAARRWTGRLCGRRSTALHAKSNLTLGLTPPAAAGAARARDAPRWPHPAGRCGDQMGRPGRGPQAAESARELLLRPKVARRSKLSLGPRAAEHGQTLRAP